METANAGPCQGGRLKVRALVNNGLRGHVSRSYLEPSSGFELLPTKVVCGTLGQYQSGGIGGWHCTGANVAPCQTGIVNHGLTLLCSTVEVRAATRGHTRTDRNEIRVIGVIASGLEQVPPAELCIDDPIWRSEFVDIVSRSDAESVSSIRRHRNQCLSSRSERGIGPASVHSDRLHRLVVQIGRGEVLRIIRTTGTTL